jgi:predicted nucleic acid-binding protein
MKRRAVLADTGPLYAAADPDDAHHKRAHQELQKLAREQYEVLVAYPRYSKPTRWCCFA